MKWKLTGILAGALAVTGVAFGQEGGETKIPILKAAEKIADKAAATGDQKAGAKVGEKEGLKTPAKLPDIVPVTEEPAPIQMPEPVPAAQPTIVSEIVLPRPTQFSLRGEYLHWSIHRAFIPPLVTTSSRPTDDKGNVNTGVLNQPDTQVLFGGEKLKFDTSPGFRGFTRFELAPDGLLALEIGGFFLQPQTTSFTISNNNTALKFYTRPFFDVYNNVDSGFDTFFTDQVVNGIAFAGVDGTLSINARHQLWGFETNLATTPWERSSQLRFATFYLGYRHLSLHESLSIREDLLAKTANGAQQIKLFFPAPVNNPTGVEPLNGGETLVIQDAFTTSNRFHGAQMGTNVHWEANRFSFDILAKVAAGIMIQKANLSGSSERLAANGASLGIVNSGIFVLDSNRTAPGNKDRYRRNEFALVPEIGFRAGYDLTNRFRIHVGYDVLYVSTVARAGSQINNFIDIRQVPTDPNFLQNLVDNQGNRITPREPRFNFRDDAYWAHGVNFGVEFHF